MHPDFGLDLNKKKRLLYNVIQVRPMKMKFYVTFLNDLAQSDGEPVKGNINNTEGEMR